MKSVIAWTVAFLFVLALCAGIGLLLAFPVKWCWNYAAAPTLALREITWGQAWCLMFLAGMLVKSTQSSATVRT